MVMKHNYKVISLMLILFLLAQVVGLVVVDYYITSDLPLGIEKPDFEPNTSFIPLFFFILVATFIILLIFKLELFWLWRFWFFISVLVTLIISFNVFFGILFAIIFAFVLTLWRLFIPNPIVHNFTELFIYGAMATIFVPILNLWSIFILLILISIYDYIAVRKTKHMVKMAKSQTKAKLFAGLAVPYEKNVAILGGGDIGFPLLFAAVVMINFNLNLFDFRTYIVPLFSGLMLFTLFTFGEKKKYYPAMPYITLGCVLGLGILLFFI